MRHTVANCCHLYCQQIRMVASLHFSKRQCKVRFLEHIHIWQNQLIQKSHILVNVWKIHCDLSGSIWVNIFKGFVENDHKFCFWRIYSLFYRLINGAVFVLFGSIDFVKHVLKKWTLVLYFVPLKNLYKFERPEEHTGQKWAENPHWGKKYDSKNDYSKMTFHQIHFYYKKVLFNINLIFISYSWQTSSKFGKYWESYKKYKVK